MDGQVADERARRVLEALADLSPSEQHQESRLTIPTEWFRWLDAGSSHLFRPSPFAPPFTSPEQIPETQLEALTRAVARQGAISPPYAEVNARTGGELQAVDRLRAGQRSLRAGWLFVAGPVPIGDGRKRRVFFPLVSVPVRVSSAAPFGNARINVAGDVQISDLVTDTQLRHDLEATIEWGGGALDAVADPAIPDSLLSRLSRLHTFASSAATACGFAASRLVAADAAPDRFMAGNDLVVVAGVGVYAIHGGAVTSRANSLRSWSSGPLDRWSAFHSLYVGTPPESSPPTTEPALEVESPFVLTEAQESAVRSSRTQPITVVSGAPGTGKSHTVVAIACDALARGESVLVAARSDDSVDALLDLLERAPGPDPVVFGSNERRDALAQRLSSGQLAPIGGDRLTSLDERRRADWMAHRTTYESIRAQLAAATGPRGDDPTLERARTVAPALFESSADLDQIGTQLHDLTTVAGSGWWARRRRRRQVRSIARQLGGSRDATADELHDALRLARAERAMAAAQAAGGLEIGDRWEVLARTGDQARESTAKWLAAETRSSDRLDRSALLAVGALATALRSGRGARRQQLARLDDDLTRALPLWIGSLGDIDDLLPAKTALFDLVIVDEASSVDQPLAAPAVLRGKRAVVVGDPRQLRHVSFIADEQQAAVLTRCGLADDPLAAAQLDVRRNSVFDAAAAVAPVMTLEEQFRSSPHLIDFVATKLYDGQLKVTTRAPSTQSKRCIEVVRLDGSRAEAGVVAAEVAWVTRWLRSLRGKAVGTVGIVTPFRAQADALEERILRDLTPDEIEALDLKVGTVHSFQGNERDIVVISIGLDGDSTATSWRFVEDPHLFAVMATRARRHLTMLISGVPPAGGLVAGYLDQADRPPGPPPSIPPTDPWVRDVASDLTMGDAPIICGYPTGRHALDIAAADQDLFIECTVHPDGLDEHIVRHLELRRAGWKITEAHRSRWEERRGELVVELLDQMRRGSWRSGDRLSG